MGEGKGEGEEGNVNIEARNRELNMTFNNIKCGLF